MQVSPSKKIPRLYRFFGGENALFSFLNDTTKIVISSQVERLSGLIDISSKRLAESAQTQAIVIPPAQCQAFLDADRTNSASKLLANVSSGFRDRDLKNLIGLVSFDDLDDDVSVIANESEGRKILLLVEVAEKQEVDGWLPTSGGSTTKILVTPPNVLTLLHDIYLDILMGNSFPARKAFKKTDREIIYNHKVSFVISKKLASYYGIIDPNAGYVSFTSCFRRSNSIHDIDWAALVEFWIEFVGLYGGNVPIVAPEFLASEVLRRHRRGGQLSHAGLAREMEGIEAGAPYFLLVSERRPHDVKDRERIAGGFRRSVWEQNMWRIIEAESIGNHRKDIEDGFLSAYKFIR